jgi:[ribosomal protein S18]-alanine N-acetyltransferase
MTPVAHGFDLAELSAIHAESFATHWSVQALSDLLATPGTFAHHLDGGFIVVRVVKEEAEILTLAVSRTKRRRGIAANLVRSAAARATQHGAGRLFLEVASRNLAARSLYGGLGFNEVGRRKDYYALGEGKFDDALILRCNLPLRPLGKPSTSG